MGFGLSACCNSFGKHCFSCSRWSKHQYPSPRSTNSWQKLRKWQEDGLYLWRNQDGAKAKQQLLLIRFCFSKTSNHDIPSDIRFLWACLFQPTLCLKHQLGILVLLVLVVQQGLLHLENIKYEGIGIYTIFFFTRIIQVFISFSISFIFVTTFWFLVALVGCLRFIGFGWFCLYWRTAGGSDKVRITKRKIPILLGLQEQFSGQQYLWLTGTKSNISKCITMCK